MLRNFFKIAIRNLWRSPSFSIINILGLAIGMAAALLIGLWINNELSVDSFYTNKDRIYHMYSRERVNGKVDAWSRTPSPLAAELKRDFPEVEEASRFRPVYFLVSEVKKQVSLPSSGGAFADSGLLSIVDLPLLQGTAKTALNNPYGIVLTAHLAKTLFGNEDPMGKIVRIDTGDNFTVTGVLKDFPPNTAFTFKYLLPWAYVDRLGWDRFGGTWEYTNSSCYMLLRPGASMADFNKKVQHIIQRHITSGQGLEREIFAEPITREHLYSKVENGELVAGQLRTVQMFIIIAVFILLIACINFMNLSTARSERRAREVGIRKVHGALRSALITQFIGESILIATLAFIVALFVVMGSLKSFDQVIGIPLVLDLSSPQFWLFSVGFVLLTGILAGSYPAFFLSAARPVNVLKGATQKVNALITPRKVLVVLQFTFAIILISCTLIVENQLHYARSRDAGYDKDRLAYTFVAGNMLQHYEAIRHELLSSGAAVGVTKTYSPMVFAWDNGPGYSWPGSTPADKGLYFTGFGADVDFVKTTGTRLIEGRDLDLKAYPTDTFAVLLNETAVRTMRLRKPLGSTITDANGASLHVIGVIKDFIISSPYEPINPMIVKGLSSDNPVINFRFNPNRPLAEDVATAGKIFRQYNPQIPFECFFVNDEYNNKFRAEQQEGTLGSLFAILTIFISCLGLFGLAAYMAESRIREIGIRKVLGASVTGITVMIAGDFIKLVLISLVLATPVAWLSMNSWLQSFTYRIHITGGIFLLAGLLAIGIALLTVGYQSIRAALTNPVKSLRSE